MKKNIGAAGYLRGVRLCALAVGFIAGCGVMHADSISFAGTATGSFNGSGSTLGGLTYSSHAFSGATSNSGFLSIGGAASNFGTLSLADTTFNYGAVGSSSNTFELMLTFTAPSDIVGSQSTTFTSDVFGSVTQGVGGGVNIAITDPNQMFTLPGINGISGFTLHINDLAVEDGDTMALNGFIQTQDAAVTPELATFPLLLTACVMAVPVMMRYRWA